MTKSTSTMELSAEMSKSLRTGASASSHWDVSLRPGKPGSFPSRLASARTALARFLPELTGLPKTPPPGDLRTEALIDVRSNPRLLRAAILGVTPRPGDRDELPRVLTKGTEDEPRILAVGAAYLRAARGHVKPASISYFLQELQKHDPLTLNEIWNIPAYLNFALLEAILAQCRIVLETDSETAASELSTLMNSLRTANDMDWPPLLESQIVFDLWLRRDPTGTFSRMEFETRQDYRNRVALLARNSDFSECQVAAQALELAQLASHNQHADPRMHQRFSHIGYYLIDKGVDRLGTKINYHPRPVDRIRSFMRRNADDVYITGIELITIIFISAALFPLLPNHAVGAGLILAFLLMIMPTMQSAVELVNNSISAIFLPEALPKLDFTESIPAECATLVVVPTLLLSERQVREMTTEMEVRYLANRDPNLHFALLTDLPDSVSKPHANDSNPLVDLAIQLTSDLNARYVGQGRGSFLLLHRHRIFNVRQGVWMGWERKRGKLLDLNKLLVGEYDAFPIKAGNLDALRSVRYILTLDSDTQLPRSTAARMIGALAHPLNQAVIDPKLRIVVEGYGILQPRIGVSVSSASRSRLAHLFSGQSGFDIYSRAISDPYQDLYGEGIFTGKGLYEVSALHAVLNKRFPRNSLLSHDLIEGAYARAGLVTDVELIDDYPTHYSAYTRRKHRWVRGDWQITQWMFSHVPDETGNKVPNPISTVSRWKIFDNLRRSLVEPFTFILFVAGWLWLPGGPVYWTVVPLLLFFFPTLVQTGFGLGRALLSPRKGATGDALAGAGQAALLALLNLFFLPHQAMLTMDAVVRALIRRFITGERLLEWETAAEAESATRKSTPVDRYLALMPILSAGIALVLFLVKREALLIAAPMLLGWCMATVLTAWLNRPRREVQLLQSDERRYLLSHALRIWRYFNEFGGESHNYLIPDNVEQQGMYEAARVSPTNVGLLLNSRQAALEFGFLTLPEAAHLTERSLHTVERLVKLRGHLYNWYDTRTCQPIEASPFVSTVDSGNLVASLYTLHSGLGSAQKKPLLSPAVFTGLRPHWAMMQQDTRLQGPVSKLSLPAENASSGEWLAWLPHAEAALAQTIPAGNDPWWHAEMHRRVSAILNTVRQYMPWLDPRFAGLREVTDLGLGTPSENLSVEQAADFAELLQVRLIPFVEASGPRQSAAAELQQLLPDTAIKCRELLSRLRSITDQARRFAEDTEFRFLVHPTRHILTIGYDVNANRAHSACYDMLASEARIAAFIAVARGEMPQQSWFRLSRDHAHAFGAHVLMSWTGTMFEYMMPALWMRSYPDTLLSDTLNGCVRVQRAFGRSQGIPWGISESGAARKDEGGHYTYKAYGIPQIALSSEATAGPVVSPYSTFLAMGVDPFAALDNLRKMESAGWVGAYGFYESVDYTTSARNGEVVREWMAHHQGMALLAILNCLNGNAVQEWFHANPIVQSSELLLHELPVSKSVMKAKSKEFDIQAELNSAAA